MDTPDFDSLALASRDAANKTGEHNLWNAVMHLPCWYFVGASTDDGDMEPLVGMMDDQPYLVAFTDEDRAADFAESRAAESGSEEASFMEADLPDAIEFCKALRDSGVEGVFFNADSEAFAASLSDVIDMYTRYADASS